MGLAKTLVRLLAIAASLSIWEIYLKPMYIDYLRSQGEIYGFSMAFIAYAVVLGVGYVAGSILSRGMD